MPPTFLLISCLLAAHFTSLWTFNNTETLSPVKDRQLASRMPGKTTELLRHLIGILSASFHIACTLIYYAYATIIYGTGAGFLVLCWCAICRLSRSIAGRVPVKRWIDCRLQDEFLRKVRNAGFHELNMRARLINAGEDVKMRNWDNGRILNEILRHEAWCLSQHMKYGC